MFLWNPHTSWGSPLFVPGDVYERKKPEKLVELDDLLVKYADNLEEVGEKNHGKRGFQMRTKNTKGFDISSGSGKLESVVNKTLWFGVMNPWLVCFAKRLE